MLCEAGVTQLYAISWRREFCQIALHPSLASSKSGETQTMSHTVESCPLTKLNGSLSQLHSADEDAVSWLTNYGS